MDKKVAGREVGGQGAPRRHEQQLHLVSAVGPAGEHEARKQGRTEAREDGSRAQADDFGTGTSKFEGYRCVRKKKPPGRIHGRPPHPRPFNVDPRSTMTNRTQAHQSNIA